MTYHSRSNMGYDSTFSGCLTPSKPIPEDLVRRINESDLDVRVAEDDDVSDPGDVIPASNCMHGYSYVSDIVKVQRFLAKHGIKMSGEIERNGNDGTDFDKVEAKQGRLYYRVGEVVFGKPRALGLKAVTNYAVRVFKAVKAGKEHGWRFIGWADPSSLHGPSVVAPPQLVKGTVVTTQPPWLSLSLTSRGEAKRLRDKLSERVDPKKMSYDIVSWEETI